MAQCPGRALHESCGTDFPHHRVRRNSHMFRKSNRKLTTVVAIMVVALAGFALNSFETAQAGTARSAASPFPSAAPNEVTAYSVPEARQAVSDVLAANDASQAWPAVDADLTPRLDEAAAAGGGDVLSNVLA